MLTLFAKIGDAHHAIAAKVNRTAFEHSPLLSQHMGCNVYLKCEHLQQTGSFKYRGATNKLRLLDNANRNKGVITASTGNHGQAMARAGKSLAIPVTIYAPMTAAEIKLNKIKGYGGEIILVSGDALQAELAAAKQAQLQSKLFVSPYNDEEIIAGQGTIGLEMLEQQSDLDAVFVAVGGGGLISGIGTVFKTLSPTTQIIGCWPENAPSLYRCMQANDYVQIDEQETFSDGTAGGIEPGAITLPICQQVIDRCVLVSEQAIKDAMKLIAQTDSWIVEGAAGVALAAAMSLSAEFKGKKIAIVLCGRNIVLDKFIQAIG